MSDAVFSCRAGPAPDIPARLDSKGGTNALAAGSGSHLVAVNNQVGMWAAARLFGTAPGRLLTQVRRTDYRAECPVEWPPASALQTHCV